MNTKGTRRKILSTLHPNTILKPNLDLTPNPHPTPNPLGGGWKTSLRLEKKFLPSLPSRGWSRKKTVALEL